MMLEVVDEERSDESWDAEHGDGPDTGPVKVDGRIARSKRTFAAVVDAFLELLEEGELRPTAAMVADRAGVSRRSVYVHFRDLDTLFAAAAERHYELRLLPLLMYGPLPDTLRERIAAFVDVKALRMEKITPIRRAAGLQAPFSREVATQIQAARDRAWLEVERVFEPELKAYDCEQREVVASALLVATTWPTWETLRETRGLTVAQAKAVLAHMLTKILS
jgi:AcrR family transcriptional regulator